MMDKCVYEIINNKYVSKIIFVLLFLVEMVLIYKCGKDFGKDFLYEWIYG